jgi:hypothetical protein
MCGPVRWSRLLGSVEPARGAAWCRRGSGSCPIRPSLRLSACGRIPDSRVSARARCATSGRTIPVRPRRRRSSSRALSTGAILLSGLRLRSERKSGGATCPRAQAPRGDGLRIGASRPSAGTSSRPLQLGSSGDAPSSRDDAAPQDRSVFPLAPRNRGKVERACRRIPVSAARPC